MAKLQLVLTKENNVVKTRYTWTRKTGSRKIYILFSRTGFYIYINFLQI